MTEQLGEAHLIIFIFGNACWLVGWCGTINMCFNVKNSFVLKSLAPRYGPYVCIKCIPYFTMQRSNCVVVCGQKNGSEEQILSYRQTNGIIIVYSQW